MPWKQLYTDNFNRANENPLAAPWQNYGGGNPGPCSLNTNKVWEQNGGGVFSVSHYNQPIKSNQYAQAAIDSSVAYNAFFGVAVRFGGAGQKRGYWGAVLPLTLQWSIHRYTSPGDVAIAGGPYGAAGVHFLRLEVIGSKLSLYKQGVLLGSVIDATYTDGWPGVVATTGGLQIDDFSAGEFSPLALPGRGKFVLGTKPKTRMR